MEYGLKAFCFSVTYLVKVPHLGHIMQVVRDVVERLKVGVGQVVKDLLDVQHPLLGILHAVCVYHRLVQLCGINSGTK